MHKYHCRCVVPGCKKMFRVIADDWESAFNRIFAEGKNHVVENHPDFPITDDAEAKGREYVMKEMKEE